MLLFVGLEGWGQCPPDDEDPVITCPADVTTNVGVGSCVKASASVSLGTPVASDNCSVFSVVNNATLNFTLGSNTVTWTVTDGSGLKNTCEQIVTVVDTINPAITCPADVTTNVGVGSCVKASASVSLGTPVTSDNCSVFSVVNNATLNFTLGSNTVTWIVTDGSGLTNTCEQIVTVVDNILPTITCPVDANVNSDQNVCTASVATSNPTTNDNCSVSKLTWSMTGATVASSAATGINYVGTDTFNLGETTITYIVTDGSNNTATCSYKVTVTDNEPPIAKCKPLTVNLDVNGNASITIDQINDVSTDNCGIQSLSLSKTNFNCSEVGANTVTLMVRDNNGNQSTCNATVTVRDLIAPVAICQNINADLNVLGTVSITPAQINNLSSDACGIASLVLSNTSFNCDSVGLRIVALTVRDNNGNQSTCNATVTVRDLISPAMICKNINVFLDVFGNASIVPANIDAGSNDACSIATLIASKTTFTCFDLGINNITLTATDVNGNSASCVAQVNLDYLIKPVSISNTKGDTVCSGSTISFALTSNNPLTTFSYTLVSNPASIVGVQNGTGNLMSQMAVNQGDSLGTVRYRVNPNTFGCPDDDLFVQYIINPVPSINVSIIDTVLCDNELAQINISDRNGMVSGNKIYNLVTQYESSDITGVRFNGEYPRVDFPQQLLNKSDSVQKIVYSFEPLLKNIKGNNPFQYCANGQKKLITLYVNPKPKLNMLVSDTIYCDSSNVSFSLNSLNGKVIGDKWYSLDVNGSGVTDGKVIGDKWYSLDVNGSGVTGNKADGYYALDNFNNVLVNNVLDYRKLEYHVTAKIKNPRMSLDYCEMGYDTTVNIYINPRPRIIITVDTLYCDSSKINFQVASGNGNVLGEKYYRLERKYNYFLLKSIQADGYKPLSSFSDSLFNFTPELQKIEYRIIPYIKDPRANQSIDYCTRGFDTLITISVMPDLKVIVSSNEYVGGRNIRCFGESNGNAIANVTGGYTVFKNYTQDSCVFNWSNGQKPRIINNLPIGVYSVTVQDKKGCIARNSLQLTQPALLTSEVYVSDSIDCYGDSDGGLGVNIAGGSTEYGIYWKGPNNFIPSTKQIIGGLSEGFYTVNITDANGCKSYSEYPFAAPYLISFDMLPGFYGKYNTSCYKKNDAYFRPTIPSGGKGEYIYEWTDSLGTVIAREKDIYNLTKGSYYLKVTDERGCFVKKKTSISQPDSIRALVALSNYYNGVYEISCFSYSNGFARLNPKGGHSNFRFEWSGDSIKNKFIKDQNLMPAGVYNYTIHDSIITYVGAIPQVHRCNVSGSLTLRQPDSLSITFTASNFTGYNVSCFNSNNGLINTNINGGVSPYSYKWNSQLPVLDSLKKDIRSLRAGLYSIGVTYGLNCYKEKSITLVQPDSFNVSFDKSFFNGYEIRCKSGSDAYVNPIISGGAGGYKYFWKVISGRSKVVSNELNQDSLFAGNFQFTITDSNSCKKTLAITLNEPADMMATMVKKEITCNPLNDGTAEIFPTGGVSPYTFLWSNQSLNAKITGLTDGTYSVRVTDLNDCFKSYSTKIIRPPLLVTTINAGSNFNGAAISCYGANDGKLSAYNSGGKPPYKYFWNTGDSVLSISNLAAGLYIFTLRDTVGCEAIDSVNLIAPAKIKIDINKSNISCFGALDGSATAIVFGGVAPYTYRWSDGSSNVTARDLSSGDYKVTVRDQNFCSYDTTIVVSEPPKLYSTFAIAPPSCPETFDGSIIASPKGGTPPYTFLWAENGISPVLEEISAGRYLLSLYDSKGCITKDVVVVRALRPACLDIPTAFTPNGDGFNDRWEILTGNGPYLYKIQTSHPDVNIKVMDRKGRVVFDSGKGYAVEWDGTYMGVDLPSDSYYYTIYLKYDQEPYIGVVTIVR